MADTKISQFAVAAALGGDEKLAGVQSGGNVSVTPAQIKTYLDGLKTVTDGVWTPTLTNTANVTSSLAFECHYLRIGSIVVIGGTVRVVPTDTASVATLSMTPPIASDFTSGGDCGGTAAANDISLANQVAHLQADATSNLINLRYVPTNTNTHNFDFVAIYRIR